MIVGGGAGGLLLTSRRLLPRSRSVSPCTAATARRPKPRPSRHSWKKSIVGGLSIAARSHSRRLLFDSQRRLHPSVLHRQLRRNLAIRRGSTLGHRESQAMRADRSRLVWSLTAWVTPRTFALLSQRANRKQLNSANRFPEPHRSAVLRCASQMVRRNSASGGLGLNSLKGARTL